MIIKDFYLEKWLNPRVGWKECEYNLGSSCVKPLLVDELFELIGEDLDAFMKEFKKMDLHYGHFFGFERLLNAISKMYENVEPNMILTTHGGTGANNMVISEFVEPGDNVIAFIPSYQQHYSIPESLGAEVRYQILKPENNYLPDLAELESQIDSKTKMITMSNPNNPTGSFIGRDLMEKISNLADKVGAYILSDEIYRGLDDEYMTSAVDIYDRAIVTSSTSKVFSMAGTRVGWIATRDKEIHDRLENRRSYDTICGGIFDEWITAIAFEHYEKILERSRKIVNANRAIFDQWIPNQKLLQTPEKSYGPTAFVTYDYNVDSASLADDMMYKTGVLVLSGHVFELEKTFRLGYGYIEKDRFEIALDKMEQYFNSLKTI